MSTVRVRADLLIGRMVLDPSGRKAGRIHEMTIEVEAPGSSEYVVREFKLSAGGWLEALVGRELTAAIARRRGRESHQRTIGWADLDLSDPEKPRLRRPLAEIVSRARSSRGAAARSGSERSSR